MLSAVRESAVASSRYYAVICCDNDDGHLVANRSHML